MSDINSEHISEALISNSLTDEKLAFLAKYSGNPNLQELRDHVQSFYNKATSKVHVYRCIRDYLFLIPRIDLLPFYAKIMEIYKQSPFKIAEVGACFGTDTRKLILDGVKPEDITVFDVDDNYWKCGFELFQDEDKLQVNSLFKSLTDEDFNQDGALNNTFSSAHAGAVLHCLSKDEVVIFSTRIYQMLQTNGIFFGNTVGAEPASDWVKTPKGDKTRYLHSPASLKQVLEEIGFIDIHVGFKDRGGRPAIYEMPGVNQIFVYFVAKKA